MKKAFTLAETILVLTIIGILAAVLFPNLRKSVPDENVLKFKNTYFAIRHGINELISSDKYYLGGDLGIRIDGTVIENRTTQTWQTKYFCETLADVLDTKKINCTGEEVSGHLAISECHREKPKEELLTCNGTESTAEFVQTMKATVDNVCKQYPFTKSVTTEQIVLKNGAWIYDVAPNILLGGFWNVADASGVVAKRRSFGPAGKPDFYNDKGQPVYYKVFCVDIDGVPSNATENDCVNECPFGFGIHADGRLFNGARADEWLEKSAVQY